MVMVMMFCTVMKMREKIIFVCVRNVPRTTSMGFTRDSIVAGSMPAMMLTAMTTTAVRPMQYGCMSKDRLSLVSSNRPA